MAYAEVNGIQLYYEVKGDPGGAEVVAFLNGVMASANSWVLQLPVFEKYGCKIILHDFRGQLLSDKPEGPYTFRQHAADVKALFDLLRVEKAHLIGTSYGGEVAMRFALDYPECVKSIAVINSVSELDEVLKLLIKGWRRLAAKKDPADFFWGMAPAVYSNHFLRRRLPFLAERCEALKSVPPAYFDGQIELYDTFLNDVTMTEELAKIQCPVLVVASEDDILKPCRFSRIIADRISHSEYAVIPGCGHVTIFEKPEVLNSLLLGFIAKQAQASFPVIPEGKHTACNNNLNFCKVVTSL